MGRHFFLPHPTAPRAVLGTLYEMTYNVITTLLPLRLPRARSRGSGERKTRRVIGSTIPSADRRAGRRVIIGVYASLAIFYFYPRRISEAEVKNASEFSVIIMRYVQTSIFRPGTHTRYAPSGININTDRKGL